MSRDPSIQRPALFGVLALALLLRMGWGLTRGSSEEAMASLPDQTEYLALGRNLLHGQGLRFIDQRFGDWVYAYRTPGYPWFVAAFGANPRGVRCAQSLLDTLTVLAIYLLAGRLLPETARCGGPLIAAVFVAFNPFLIYFSGLILSETLFTAMLAWGMYLLTAPSGEASGMRAPTRRAAVFWLMGGLILALSVLVRPSALLLPILLGIASAFVNRQGRAAYEIRWPLPVATTMLLLVVSVLLPWAWRNSGPNVLGHWVWTTTNSGFTAYDGFNPDATGASDQSFLKHLPQLRDMDELARSEYLSGLASRFIREHPWRALELALAKAGRTWSPAPLSDSYSDRRYRLVALGYAVPFDLLVLAGLIIGRLRLSTKVFLLLPAIYFTAVHAASVGSLRYRVPVEPPMALLIASLLTCRVSALLPTGSSTAPGGPGTRSDHAQAGSDAGP